MTFLIIVPIISAFQSLQFGTSMWTFVERRGSFLCLIVNLITKLMDQCEIRTIDSAITIAIFFPFVHIALNGQLGTGLIFGTRHIIILGLPTIRPIAPAQQVWTAIGTFCFQEREREKKWKEKNSRKYLG